MLSDPAPPIIRHPSIAVNAACVTAWMLMLSFPPPPLTTRWVTLPHDFPESIPPACRSPPVHVTLIESLPEVPVTVSVPCENENVRTAAETGGATASGSVAAITRPTAPRANRRTAERRMCAS